MAGSPLADCERLFEDVRIPCFLSFMYALYTDINFMNAAEHHVESGIPFTPRTTSREGSCSRCQTLEPGAGGSAQAPPEDNSMPL
jgi:hypothetical protein